MAGPKDGSNGKDTEGGRLWAFVTRSVTPLAGKSRPPVPPAAGAERSSGVPKSLPPPDARLVGAEIGLKPADSGNIAVPSGGLDRRTADKLRRGKIPIEAVLDLHGLHQGAAQAELFRFLQISAEAGRRCVLVITGKGSRAGSGESGVLRRMLPLWLGLAPVSGLVLAHSPAHPRDGGEGAFYVLLRRKR